MATASVPNSFVNGTPADAVAVNANFSAVTTFLNDKVVHRDGSKAATAALDAGSFRVLRVANGTASTDAVNKSQLDAVSAAVAAIRQAPVGASMEWYTDVAPAGWLIQDGSAVSRATYSDLFSVIGVTFGVGDGSTTFNLPDRRNRFPIGKGPIVSNDTVGKVGGSRNAVVVAHTHTADPAPFSIGGGNHFHLYQVRENTTASGSSGLPMISNTSGTVTTRQTFETDGTDTEHSHTVDVPAFNTGSSGVSGTDQNLPPFFTVNFIIFTGVE